MGTLRQEEVCALEEPPSPAGHQLLACWHEGPAHSWGSLPLPVPSGGRRRTLFGLHRATWLFRDQRCNRLWGWTKAPTANLSVGSVGARWTRARLAHCSPETRGREVLWWLPFQTARVLLRAVLEAGNAHSHCA